MWSARGRGGPSIQPHVEVEEASAIPRLKQDKCEKRNTHPYEGIAAHDREIDDETKNQKQTSQGYDPYRNCSGRRPQKRWREYYRCDAGLHQPRRPRPFLRKPASPILTTRRRRTKAVPCIWRGAVQVTDRCTSAPALVPLEAAEWQS
jgi:hypothetical protein